jgi:hypothetical protein
MLDQGVARIKKLTDGWEDGGTASFVGLLEDFRKQFTAIPQEGFAWSGKTGWC